MLVGFGEPSMEGTMSDQVTLVTIVRKSPPLNGGIMRQ